MALMSFLKSTILSKVVMAATGVILVLFIIGHTLGNMQMYIGQEAFNAYAHFLQSLGELLWIFRIVMFISLILHVITSIRLKLLNLSAKPTKYKVKNYLKAKLTSRTMIWTGIMVFAFLVYHLLHFTGGIIDASNYGHPEAYGPGGIFERHDVYFMVIHSFQQLAISIPYIVGVVLLGFHLNHAIQSAFQTLGVNHPKYTPCIGRWSVGLSVIIVLLLISLPISILLGFGGGTV